MKKKALLNNARTCIRAMSDSINEEDSLTACDDCEVRRHLKGGDCDCINGPREIITQLLPLAEHRPRAAFYKIAVGALVLIHAGALIRRHHLTT